MSFDPIWMKLFIFLIASVAVAMAPDFFQKIDMVPR